MTPSQFREKWIPLLTLDRGSFDEFDQDLKELVDPLQAEIYALREAISPGRIKDLCYYVGVARRMRERELVIRPMELSPLPASRRLRYTIWIDDVSVHSTLWFFRMTWPRPKPQDRFQSFLIIELGRRIGE